jgi:flagellar hook-basal body complex protein FliE
MSSIGPVNSALTALPLIRPESLPSTGAAGSGLSTGAAGAGGSFTNLLDGLVSSVGAKEANANDLTRQVLLGQSGSLHQSVIAMQEASVAFSLMVQVRNKLVDSYQELMRMQV